MTDLLHYALSFYGTKEFPGTDHNPVILNWFHDIGHNWVKTDEVASCSAFINHCAKHQGYEYTRSLNARSWLDIGWPVEVPRPGDLVIFWRGKDKFDPIPGTKLFKGHVGIYVNESQDSIYTLGANQGDEVNISPYSNDRFMEFRRLRKL